MSVADSDRYPAQRDDKVIRMVDEVKEVLKLAEAKFGQEWLRPSSVYCWAIDLCMLLDASEAFNYLSGRPIPEDTAGGDIVRYEVTVPLERITDLYRLFFGAIWWGGVGAFFFISTRLLDDAVAFDIVTGSKRGGGYITFEFTGSNVPDLVRIGKEYEKDLDELV